MQLLREGSGTVGDLNATTARWQCSESPRVTIVSSSQPRTSHRPSGSGRTQKPFIIIVSSSPLITLPMSMAVIGDLNATTARRE